MQLTPQEMSDILNWISDPNTLPSLPMDEQLCIQMAYLKSCEMIKPIYDKYNKEEIWGKLDEKITNINSR